MLVGIALGCEMNLTGVFLGRQRNVCLETGGYLFHPFEVG